MQPKPIEYCLDEILKQLEINYGMNPRPSLDSKALLKQFDVPQERHEFFKGLINILIDDGYVDFLDEIKDRKAASLLTYQERPILLPRGFYLLQANGYTQQTKDRLTMLKDQNDRNQRTERNEERLVRWTKNLFYGTIAAAIVLVTWEMIKTFCIEHYASNVIFF
jgi:hypothetical protein